MDVMGGMAICCAVGEAAVRPSDIAVDGSAAWLIVMAMNGVVRIGGMAMDVAMELDVAAMDVAMELGGMEMDVAMGLDGAVMDVAVGLDGAAMDVAVGLDLGMAIGLDGVRRQTIGMTTGSVNCSGGAS